MIENLQDELSQSENKQAVPSIKFCANKLDGSYRAKSSPNLPSNWKTEYWKSNNIWIIYTDEFARGAYFLCCWYIIGAEVLASSINANKRIKGI